MYTRCPACHTLFRIQAQQLKAARGKVRCGQCQTTFDALTYLVSEEELSESERRTLAPAGKPDARQWHLPFDEHQPKPVPVASQETTHSNSKSGQSEAAPSPQIEPQHEGARETEQVTTEPLPDNVPPGETAPAAQPLEEESAEFEQELPVSVTESAPVTPRYSLPEAEQLAPPSLLARLGWTFATLLMVAMLAGQLIFAYRESLALDPRWRPWLEQACQVAGCTLPVQRDLASIEMVGRTVVSHPKYQNALLITATLLNKASFAQPYPQVELTMTDLDQKVVASRLFKPSEYLKDTPPNTLFAAGGAVQLELEIADPGEEAVGFEFNFY
jgi:predicted Zn finger-like uncharacterized protein